jgi:large subunit ribosomal protein L13
MITIKRATHTIDATGIVLGKLATQVAVLLRGKDKPGFVPHVDAGDFVVVKNFKNVKITGGKMENEVDYHYTGHMGGLKEETWNDVMAKDPAKLLRRAVYRMLPDNKLRDRMIKRLSVTM